MHVRSTVLGVTGIIFGAAAITVIAVTAITANALKGVARRVVVKSDDLPDDPFSNTVTGVAVVLGGLNARPDLPDDDPAPKS